MLEEDYCSYEVAKLLKEKGFDYQGFDYIDFEGEVIKQDRPTHQMAMKWLRENHNIFIQISAVLQDQPFGLHYRPSIQDYHAYARHDNFSEYVTYEEAIEAALKYSLENLI